MATATINLVILSRECEAFFMGNHVFAPIASGSVARVAEAIAAYGEPTIPVEFRTILDEKAMQQDRKKFAKRLANLATASGYTAGEFVQDGPNAVVFRATMTRNT